jgi:hypothetical protein
MVLLPLLPVAYAAASVRKERKEEREKKRRKGRGREKGKEIKKGTFYKSEKNSGRKINATTKASSRDTLL